MPFWFYILLFAISQTAAAMGIAFVPSIFGWHVNANDTLVALLVANILAISLFLPWRPSAVTWKSIADSWRKPIRSITLSYIAAAPPLIVAVNLLQENCLDFLPDFVGEHNVDAILANPVGIITVCILGPIAEEMLFRAGVQGALRRHPVFWSSIIFALIHMNPAQIPAAFLLGLLLGFAYQQTGSLTAPILIHILNNTLASALATLTPDDTTLTSLVGGSISAVFVGAGCLFWAFLCLKNKFSLYNKV